MTDAHSDSLEDTRIEAILERWFEGEHSGQRPPLEELCANEPELLPRVRAMLERQAALLGETPAGTGASQPPRSPVLGVDRLGDFELKTRIGSGGMGDVYLARQVSLDRMVAIKVLRRDLADDPVRRLRFKREAQLTAALDHPNIVPIYGTGEDEGCVYLVMKLLGGATLDRVDFAWTPRRTAEVAAQVARALDATHAVGIVHRDIKPGNIQLDGDDAFVLDFGLARGRIDLTLTTDGQAPGTLAYMPPEQLRGDATAIDPRGDIYSLGVTMYQMLAGGPPFADESPELLVRHALLNDPESLYLGSADRDLETIIMRALEKDPARRFQTAQEFVDDLERYLTGQPIRSRPPSALTRAVKLARRHRVKTAMLATALLVSGIFGVQLWRNSQAEAARLTREFEQVETSLTAERPATALDLLRTLEADPAARADDRLTDLHHLATSALALNTVLDRIQLDSIYQETVLDEELRTRFEDAHPKTQSSSMTAVARAFLAFHARDRAAMGRQLETLEAKNEFPRLRAALQAELADSSPIAALGAIAAESTADDHVFTAALLLLADHPAQHAVAEIEIASRLAPERTRVRIMVGVGHLKLGRIERARDTLNAIWHLDEPRPELHCVLGRLATAANDLEDAEAAFDRAQRDLERMSRSPIRRLAVARIELATQRGDFEAAAQLLASSRQEFEPSEWIELADARLRLAQNDVPAARIALEQAERIGHLPWTRRQTKLGLLRLDVEDFVLATETYDRADPKGTTLLARADPIMQLAIAADDRSTQANASICRFKIQSKLAELSKAEDRGSEHRRWRRAAWNSLVDAVEKEHLHPFGTSQLAFWMFEAIDTPNSSEDQLTLGDLTFQARSRAQKITDQRFANREISPLGCQTAILGAYLAEAVDSPEASKRMGAIATVMFEGLSEPQQQDLAGFMSLLGRVRQRLGLDEWPAPAER